MQVLVLWGFQLPYCLTIGEKLAYKIFMASFVLNIFWSIVEKFEFHADFYIHRL